MLIMAKMLTASCFHYEAIILRLEFIRFLALHSFINIESCVYINANVPHGLVSLKNAE